MSSISRFLRSALALGVLATTLSACCGDNKCIKDPPCKPKCDAPAAAPAPAPAPAK